MARMLCMYSVFSVFFINASAVTLQEAKDAVDTVFTRQFGTHYTNNIWFWDGSSQRMAYAMATTGDTASGGCGYNLTNIRIAITFDLETDSTGAEEEGVTVLKMDPPTINTTYEAQIMVSDFLYATVEGPAGIGETSITYRRVCFNNIRFQSPNNGKSFKIFTDGKVLPSDLAIVIYDISGKRKGAAIIKGNNIYTTKQLSAGLHLANLYILLKGYEEVKTIRFVVVK